MKSWWNRVDDQEKQEQIFSGISIGMPLSVIAKNLRVSTSDVKQFVDMCLDENEEDDEEELLTPMDLRTILGFDIHKQWRLERED